MALTTDLRGQDPTGHISWLDTVDGLPLVEPFDDRPSIETWLATLWGIGSGQSSPRPVDGSWRWGWNALRHQGTPVTGAA